MNRLSNCLRATGVLLYVAAPLLAMADWPMAGHDVRRSSWAPEDDMPPAVQPVWHVVIEPYIPSRANLVTVKGKDGRPDLVFVPTADGVYALRADNGGTHWFYPTPMPVGHSPAVVDNVLYVGCYDGRIHAVEIGNGKPVWKTRRAGAGFDTSPLVVGGRVYAGCRDGYFYAFDARDGHLVWYFATGGPVSYSAAYDDGVVFFASNDGCAYALGAEKGDLKWKSTQLPGDGFYGFWPVVAGDRVLFAGSTNHLVEGPKLVNMDKEQAFPPDARPWDPIGPVDGDGWIDASRFVEYLKAHPARRTLFVLDKATGCEVETAPILWWGNPSGNRYPPAVGPDGVVYTNTPWAWSPDFLKGRIAAWKPGAARLYPIPDIRNGLDSNDEPHAQSLIGKDAIYYNQDSDKEGGVYALDGTPRGKWTRTTFETAFPGYQDNWRDRKYGNHVTPGLRAGTHGNQNPPVPLNGRVYFHRSNAVMCFGPAGTKPVTPPARPTRPTGLTSPIRPTDLLPTVASLEDRLAREIARMIEAGHLRPAYMICGEHYYLTGRTKGDCIQDYWHNPAETIYTLVRALPHVKPDLREKAKAYLKKEFETCPPYQYTHVGWKNGVPRELFPLPPEAEAFFVGGVLPVKAFQGRAGVRAAPGNYSRPFAGWTFNPLAYYACWQYAKVFGGEKELFGKIAGRAEPLPARNLLRERPSALNTIIAGYIGYLNLEEAAGAPRSSDVAKWLDAALEMRVADLAIAPKELDGTEAGGFLFLVPELGDHLYKHAREAVARNVAAHAKLAPYWFAARTDEMTRYETRTVFQEGATSHYYEYSSLFNAKALALKESRSELDRWLDVPAVARGDLFYIQNLVATLEAKP